MRKFLATILISMLFISNAFAGKLQGSDFKTEAQLISAGATKSSFLDDTKIYITANGVNDKLSTAITSGLIGGSGSSLLANGGFEVGTASWTNANGVFTATTTAGEFTDGLKAAKIALTSQVLNFSQTVNTTSGIQKQGVIGAAYKVPSAVTDFQICSLVDASEQVCVPSANLINDGLYHSIEIPITFGATSAGIKFKTTASYTQNVFFDKAYLNQGIGYQNLMLDNVYTANITSTSGVVANTNVANWITCTAANPTVCTFKTGLFTVKPICTTGIGSQGSRYAVDYNISGVTNNSITLYTTDSNTSGAIASVPFALSCQKSGNDYLTSSASVYTQANANTEWATCTFSTLAWQGLGTVTNNSLKCRRSGSNLEIMGRFTNGTTSGSTAQIPLPSNWGAITSDASLAANSPRGFLTRDQASEQVLFGALLQPSVNYMNLGAAIAGGTSTSPVAPQVGTAFGSSLAYDVSLIQIPITGWSNPNLIVGSFAGYPVVPGYGGNVDTFSFNFGTTNAITVCSASPCSYLDQIGTSVSSVTRSGTGLYTMNTAATYLKLKCKEDWAVSSAGDATGNLEGFKSGAVSEMGCTNCNSLAFRLINYNATAQVDGFLGITCIGTR